MPSRSSRLIDAPQAAPTAERWILSAHASPEVARTEWYLHGVAMLPLGAQFSAVRVPGHLVRVLAASSDPLDADAVLVQALDGGPVICDLRGPRYYALVPSGVPRTWRQAAEDWRQHEVECLGHGTYLGVPRLDAVAVPLRGNGCYWSVPLVPTGKLCKPLSVARLIAAGVHALEEDRTLWSAGGSNPPPSPTA